MNIKEQINLAKLSGGTKKVRSKVSGTGMHDTASSIIIEHLLELGKWLQKQTAGKPNLPEEDVHATLENDLKELLGGNTIDNYINLLLGIPGLDIHKDTLTEILHTILLGVVKYYWGQTAFILDKAHMLKTFQVCVEMDICAASPGLDSLMLRGLVEPAWTLLKGHLMLQDNYRLYTDIESTC